MSMEECRYFLSRYSFGTLITSDLALSHVPFIMPDEDTIETHLASGNHQVASLDNQPCLLSILGPHAFIATTNYITKPAVPTWNYASVSIKGKASLMSPKQLSDSLNQMLSHFQHDLVEDKITLPDEFREKLMQSIIGVRIDITEMRGKLKLGQHRCIEDQRKVFEKLSDKGADNLLYANFAQQWLERFRPDILTGDK
ncbi:FMN-binding negative transcriptional regulator [Dickeya oryzae]|nr:FMN-binding negative transcriptional regulator [Dickeya oryzae]